MPTNPSDTPPAAPILGIDPGLQRTGYALLAPAPLPREANVIEAGVIRLDSRTSLATRLVELEREVVSLLETHHPASLACEELYAHYKHPRTAILMGHARGVVLLAASRAGLPVLPVAATNVKKLLTGSGRASKQQVQFAITATLNLPQVPEPDDVADAIAIALAGLRLQHADDVRGPVSRRAQA